MCGKHASYRGTGLWQFSTACWAMADQRLSPVNWVRDKFHERLAHCKATPQHAHITRCDHNACTPWACGMFMCNAAQVWAQACPRADAMMACPRADGITALGLMQYGMQQTPCGAPVTLSAQAHTYCKYWLHYTIQDLHVLCFQAPRPGVLFAPTTARPRHSTSSMQSPCLVTMSSNSTSHAWALQQ